MTKKKRNLKAKVKVAGRTVAYVQEVKKGGKLSKPKPVLITVVKPSGGKKK